MTWNAPTDAVLRLTLWFARVSLTLLVAACGTNDAKVNANPGSETHWLSVCTSQDECGEGLCVCGVCTRACSSNASCAELGDGAHCVAPEERASCDAQGAPERVCLPTEPAREAGVEGNESPLEAGDDPAAEPVTDASTTMTTGSEAGAGSPSENGADAATGAAANDAGGTDDAASVVDPAGPGSYPYPASSDVPEAFCVAVTTPASALCQGAAACPILTATAFRGSVRGISAGLDAEAHAVVTSESDVCVVKAAPAAEATASLNPFTLPEDALSLVNYPIAVSESGERHVFVAGESAAVHFTDRDGSWTSAPIAVPDRFDVRVHGAAFAGGALEIVYSAHLPNPGSAYNHALYAGRSNPPGAWETTTLWDGAGELALDAVHFPVGESDPSAYWYASREETTFHAWRRSAAAVSEPTLLEIPWDVPYPVGRLASGEALVSAIEGARNPSGPLHLGLVRDALLMVESEVPGTEGQAYNSGCPVEPGTFVMGIGANACGEHLGAECTLVVDTVGAPKWTNTGDGSAWIAFVESHREADLRLATRCLDAEIDPGCLCEADPSVPTVQRETTTLTLGRVSAAAEEIAVDVRLRLEGTPPLLFLDARGSTLVFGFDGSLVVVDSAAL